MKKMLLIVAVAFAAMSCGNKCCEGQCEGQDSVAVEAVEAEAPVEEAVEAAEAEAPVEEAAAEAEAPAAE
ncbi:MAG: hypothetical protein II140_01570 [Paludibacteraceae bacterium]|nr:hypothetical protein [Paludibacteraceae bacterium]MBQ2190750.1 hypothetical protein [Paludibacteraceae bacterium]MBQ5379752.1 hypothetical protein [Paludibacteraceae bacterium]